MKNGEVTKLETFADAKKSVQDFVENGTGEQTFSFQGFHEITLTAGENQRKEVSRFFYECFLIEDGLDLFRELEDLLSMFDGIKKPEWFKQKAINIKNAIYKLECDECFQVIRDLKLGEKLNEIYHELKETLEEIAPGQSEIKSGKPPNTLAIILELLDIILEVEYHEPEGNDDIVFI